MNVYSDSNYTVDFVDEGNILRFGWKDGHESMNYEDFKESCCNFIGFGFEYGAEKILIDVRNFALQLPPEFPEWQKKKHHPRYKKLGIQKVVYLMPEVAVDHSKKIEKDEHGFELQNFSDETLALRWLNTSLFEGGEMNSNIY
ncbi:MAG: hypothetical protein AAGD88_03395 [Bacteroidota bacterium]